MANTVVHKLDEIPNRIESAELVLALVFGFKVTDADAIGMDEILIVVTRPEVALAVGATCEVARMVQCKWL